MKRQTEMSFGTPRKLQEGIQRRCGQHGTYVMVSCALDQVNCIVEMFYRYKLAHERLCQPFKALVCVYLVHSAWAERRKYYTTRAARHDTYRAGGDTI